MCDQERAQYVALNDRLAKLKADYLSLSNEEPPRLSVEALQHVAEAARQARLRSLQSEQDVVRAALDVARDLFVSAGGDPNTLPTPA